MIEIECIDEVIRISYVIKGTKKYHREDGPAMIWKDGSTAWCLNNLIHRDDGPALEYDNGHKGWFFHGERFETKEEWFQVLTEEQKVKALYNEHFIGD